MAKEYSNPVQEAIATAVKGELKLLVTKEEFDKLADKVEEAATPKELDQKLDRLLEEKLPGLINQTLLQLLASPKKNTEGKAGTLELNGECPRQPHNGKCPSAWCIKAQRAKED